MPSRFRSRLRTEARVVIVAHMGSAHTDAELGILLDEARQIVTGEQVSLEIDVPVRRTRLQDVPAWRTWTLIPPRQSPRGRGGLGGVPRQRTQRLYDVLGAAYDWLGFDAVPDRVFRDLVIARIVEPTSKLYALRALADLGAEALSYKIIDHHARLITSRRYRDVVAEKCFAYARDCGGLSLLLYDVTTF